MPCCSACLLCPCRYVCFFADLPAFRWFKHLPHNFLFTFLCQALCAAIRWADKCCAKFWLARILITGRSHNMRVISGRIVCAAIVRTKIVRQIVRSQHENCDAMNFSAWTFLWSRDFPAWACWYADIFQRGSCDAEKLTNPLLRDMIVSFTKISWAELAAPGVLSSGYNSFSVKMPIARPTFLTCFIARHIWRHLVIVSQHDHCQQDLQVGKRVSKEARWIGTR